MTTEPDALQELTDALRVDPSPDFEARVRQRVRAESHAGAWWTWPSTAAAAVALVVAAIVIVPDRVPPRQHEVSAPVSSPRVPPQAAAVRPSEAPAPDVRRHPRGAARSSRPAEASRRDAAPIVVPPNQLAGIQRLMTEIAAGRVVAAPPVPAPPAVVHVAALESPPPISSEMIRIAPLSADVEPHFWR